MKKKLITIGLILVLALQVFLLASCQSEGEQFGHFGYNGHYLTRFGKEKITATEAKAILAGETTTANASLVTRSAMTSDQPAPSAELVKSIENKYASVNITTKYYVEGEDKQQEKSNKYFSTNMINMISKNEFEPYSLTVVKGVVIFDELINYMEEQNVKFSENRGGAPFLNIFEYWKDDAGNVVIQINDFTNIPASEGGGIDCAFLQEIEIQYDNEGKMVKWQASLGVYITEAESTRLEGHIVEVELDWVPLT